MTRRFANLNLPRQILPVIALLWLALGGSLPDLTAAADVGSDLIFALH